VGATTLQPTSSGRQAAMFTETGLPGPRVWFEFWTWSNPRWIWWVTVGGQTKSSTSDTIAFFLPRGAYNYSVAIVISSQSAYIPQPESGSITVSQSNLTVSAQFVRTLTFSASFGNNSLWGGSDLEVGFSPSGSSTGGSLVAMNGTMANSFLQSLANELHGEGYSTPTSYIAAVAPSDFLSPPILTATGPTSRGESFNRLSDLYTLGQANDYFPVVTFGQGGPAITGYALATSYILNYNIRQLPGTALRSVTSLFFSPFLSAASKTAESDLFSNSTGSDTMSGHPSLTFSPDFLVGPGQQLYVVFHGLSRPTSVPQTLMVEGQLAIIPVSASHPTLSQCNAPQTTSCHVFSMVHFTLGVTVSDNYWWWRLFSWLGVQRYVLTVT